jgi:hypothetical protein
MMGVFVPSDPHLRVGDLAEVLVLSRSHPPLDALLSCFIACSSTLVHADELEVHRREPAPASPVVDEDERGHVSRHPVRCGQAEWGELRLVYHDAAPALLDAGWGPLLAEVLGAALVNAGLETAVQQAPARDADDLVDLVLHCAEALDLMTDASTRARLALVVGRLADAVGATSWSVGLRHGRRLYDVAGACRLDVSDGPLADSAVTPGELDLDDFPARLRASAGGGFYADRSTGDRAERLALCGVDAAVIGAGGYDPDGRSWVVTVRSTGASGLRHVTPVLFALVLAALSFPREAAVPRPEEPWVHHVLTRSVPGHPGAQAGEADAAG